MHTHLLHIRCVCIYYSSHISYILDVIPFLTDNFCPRKWRPSENIWNLEKTRVRLLNVDYEFLSCVLTKHVIRSANIQMLWKSRVRAQERPAVCSGALLGTQMKWGRQSGRWHKCGKFSLGQDTDFSSHLSDAANRAHFTLTGAFFIIPSHLQTHAVFCGAHQSRWAWCAEMLRRKGQSPWGSLVSVTGRCL